MKGLALNKTDSSEKTPDENPTPKFHAHNVDIRSRVARKQPNKSRCRETLILGR
jgi:hypothetical protein